MRWVDSPGRGICWVLLAGNVACDNSAFVSREDIVDSPEDDICLSIMAPFFPPTLDDASIVAEEPKVLSRLTKHEDSKDKELKANFFGPPNVPSFCVPSQNEPPGSPTAGDDNRDSNSGAGIREKAIVFDVTRTRDSARKFLGAEGVGPPLEIVIGIPGWVVWSERICNKGSQHGLQVGEVSTPCRCHEAGV